MERYEIAIEVGPIDPATVERLKQAGHAVYRGNRTWRVVASAPAYSQDSVRAQAHAFARSILDAFDLDSLHEPPVVAIRDPEGIYDTASTALLLDDIRKSYDPDPLRVTKRSWWQKQMELGLGERKGD